MDRTEYTLMDMDNKLMVILHELRHMSYYGFNGKGSQNRILRLLEDRKSLTQRELTEIIGIQPGSASEVLGKLEKGGYLVRTPSETDRRTTDVRLTDLGRVQAEKISDMQDRRVHEMFAVLSCEEKTKLLKTLEKLYHAWNTDCIGKCRQG